MIYNAALSYTLTSFLLSFSINNYDFQWCSKSVLGKLVKYFQTSITNIRTKIIRHKGNMKILSVTKLLFEHVECFITRTIHKNLDLSLEPDGELQVLPEDDLQL